MINYFKLVNYSIFLFKAFILLNYHSPLKRIKICITCNIFIQKVKLSTYVNLL